MSRQGVPSKRSASKGGIATAVERCTCSSVTKTHRQMMAALMRIPPTGSTHQPFFQRVAITAMIMAAVLLQEHERKL